MEEQQDAPIGLYIHVPFCATKCPYCNFFSVRYAKDMVAAYADAVVRNLAHMPKAWQIDSIYFGGGTPSLLPPTILERFLDTIVSRCSILSPEITLEANPCTMTPERLQQWHTMGINRLSIGVQSLSDTALQLLGRNHSAKQAVDAIGKAVRAGFHNLSVDCMLGIPEQTEASLFSELQTLCSLPVTHISAYLLKIEQDTPYGQHPPTLPDEDISSDLYLHLHDQLTGNGFVHYEISNFAKPGFESRHNCKYWRCQPYFGIGPSAHSCLDRRRFDTPANLQAFCTQPLQASHLQTAQACDEAEQLMLAFRLREGIDLSQFPTVRTRLLDNANRVPSHLLVQTETSLALSPQGWLLSNAVIGRLLEGIL